MRDVDIWNALHATRVDVDVLAPLLEELEGAPFAERSPFLASVVPFVTHRSPRIRAAATRALAGCFGVEARRHIARRLDDNHAEVRAAALEALATCSHYDGAPFACAVFHRRVDVRRAALEKAPERVPTAQLVLLLALPEHQADVRAMLDRRAHDGAIATGLLAARRHKLLDDEEVRRRLEGLPWGDKTAQLLAALPWPSVADQHLATAETLRAWYTNLNQTDPLAEILGMLWRSGDASTPFSDDTPLARALVTARSEGKLQLADHRRVASALGLAMLTAADSSPRMLAMAAMAIPVLLLLEADLDRRRAALLALVDDAAPGQAGRLQELKTFVDKMVFLDDTAELDPALLAGGLRLVAEAPYQKLRDAIPTADVVKAFWRRPAAALVSLAPNAPADREAYRALVRAIIEGMRAAAPDVVAELCLALPSEGAFILDDVDKRRPGIAAAALALLLADARPQLHELALRRLERNARSLAAQLGASTLPDALEGALVVAQSAAAGPVAAATADAILQGAPHAHLERAASSLSLASLTALVRRLASTVLPVDAEHAWAKALAGSTLDEARAWAAPRLEPTAAPRAIGHGLLEHLRTCGDDELPLVASVFLREPLMGLTDALLARASVPQSARVAAELLASHDPPHVVADLFQRAIREEPPFLAAVDRALLDEDTRRDLPLLATAWVHHDAGHAVRFEHHCRVAPGGLRSVVDLALALPSPLLSWKVMRALVEVVRAWTYQRKVLLEKLDAKLAEILFAVLTGAAQPRPPTGSPSTFNGARALRHLAAELVALAHGSGGAADFVADVRQRLLDLQPSLEPDLRAILKPVCEWGPPPRPSAPGAATLDDARARLRSVDAHVARAAVDQLAKLGKDGARALVDALRESPPPLCLKTIVECAILDDEDARALLAEDVDAEVRFRVAMRLDDTKAALAAACAPLTRPWLTVEDVNALGERVPKKTLAFNLVRSPHLPAETKAVWTLLSLFHESRDDDVKDALLRFLAAGNDRDTSLRQEVAGVLLDAGHFVPTVAVEALLGDDEASRFTAALRAAIPRSLWLEIIASADLAATDPLDPMLETALKERHVDDELCARIALHFLRGHVDKDEAGPYFAALRRVRFTDDPRVDALREAVQWGVRQARVLLGHPVSVELIHDALGFTRLHQPRIFINPLPLLRGERGGDDVVRGLIAHEIGHHVYHADELGKACWADAQKEGIGSLLNLVADEHLERNLRAVDATYGDHLKVLASYAFQHMSKDVWLERLLVLLGRNAARVLSRIELLPASAYGSLHVELGKLLGEVANDTSFARFMRALRMGLGSRATGDGSAASAEANARVKAALALFEKKQFRQSKMDWLLEIARELRRIFGDEVKILDTFGFHESMEVGEEDLMEEGFNPDDLQREMDRKPGKRQQRIEKPKFNDSPDERFDPIDQVVPLAHDPSQHRVVAAQGRRATQAIKKIFDEMGVRIVNEHKRLSGRSLDRQGLASAVLKRDPRLLVRRSTVPAADLFVGIVVDCSGSMASDHSMDKARVFATSLAEAARGRDGVDVKIFGFTDAVIYEAGDADRCAAHALVASGGNNDSAGLWHAAVHARRSKRKRKLLVMVSDGMPTECSATSLRSLAGRLERSGMLTAQVAVRPIGEKMFKHYVEILGDDVDDAARRFARVISRLVKKTMGR